MRRGELWWARVPIRGATGRRRPMLVVSADAFNANERYPKVMVVHLTSVERLGGPYEWEVAIPKGTAGLSRPSVAKCSEIYTLWKENLEGPAATLPHALMRKVDRALGIALNLPFDPAV